MTASASGGAPATATYDRIGIGYRRIRRPDPRPAALVHRALAGARTVVNAGAGTGSHEPADAEVTAVDPSRVMLDQHPGRRKVLAGAEELPFSSGEFEAAMAVMTGHHWPDLHRGLGELLRVSHRQVVFTWDPQHLPELWLIEEYLPEIRQLEHTRFTSLSDVVAALDAHTVVPFAVPHDLTDGFRIAHWRRPEFCLDPAIRRASPTFAQLPPPVVERAMARLRADLASGAWRRGHTDLLNRDCMDYGCRLVVAGGQRVRYVPTRPATTRCPRKSVIPRGVRTGRSAGAAGRSAARRRRRFSGCHTIPAMGRDTMHERLRAMAGTAGYGAAAEDLADQYESVTFAEVHREVLHLFPVRPSVVLDIGAGSGRDAAVLAARDTGSSPRSPPPNCACWAGVSAPISRSSGPMTRCPNCPA
ncbi:class I SAM-dependent methyltransferase [Streptomyces sp. NPDC052109]|uniref:class I SAM-dependent methyltransferase n=1 Tax=Streptomyces sp. NPDC052109 TaxID=3155527 RepID=UPI003430E2A9